MTDATNSLVGARLNGRWQLVRLLGEGGMGVVYEADSLHGEGKRAIKLLHQEFVKEEQILSRFFAEAAASKSLRHPNVAQVFDAQTAENGTPYLVMELLQGIPLATYVEQGQAIPPQQAVPIIYGVLQALSMAHAQRIVHRDLKPDNLFLVRDQTGNFNVKVLDFGIAKVMDVAGGMGQKTRTGVLLGTPGYMSPEQIKNSKGVDARSDLWSMGIVFYELLTAKQPFPADNEFTRLTVVLTEDVKPIEQVAPHLAAWAPFFTRALAKDPAQRFQSAEEMAQALTTISRGGQLAGTTGPGAPIASSYPAAPQTMQGQQPAPHPMSQQPQTPQQYGPASMGARPQQMAPSTPPPPMSTPMSMPTHVSGAPGHGASVTHVSAQKPVGTPTVQGHTPHVEVIQPPPQMKGAPWWVVVVVAVVAFGLGLALGLAVS